MPKALDGYKTYIVAVCFGLVAIAAQLKWIDESTQQMLLTILGGGGFAALRYGMSSRQ